MNHPLRTWPAVSAFRAVAAVGTPEVESLKQ